MEQINSTSGAKNPRSSFPRRGGQRAPTKPLPPESSSRLASASIRQRARRACDPCRKRKKKCNGEFPCLLCRQYEYVCTYDSEESRGSSEILGSSSEAVAEEQAESQDINIGPPPLEFRGQKRPVETGILEPNKLRFFDGGSSVAFPHALAIALHSETAPRLHSFAYNIGIRKERFFKQSKVLMNYLSYEEAETYANVFFRTVNTQFAVVDDNTFFEVLINCWDPDKVEDESTLMTEIVCCYVVALGSFYSWPKAFERETELVHEAEGILDRATYHEAPSLIRINHARAWLLRTMYCRTSTRPNIAWLASCMSVRVCESLGMHKEVSSLKMMAPQLPSHTPEELEDRRRLFWVTWSINHLESFNYGRSSVYVSGINIKLPEPVPNSDVSVVVGIAHALHRHSDDPLSMNPDQCVATLEEMEPGPQEDSALTAMIRTEVACALYRRLRALDRNLAHQSVEKLMSIGKLGLKGARAALEQGVPWFKLASTPFQFACTVISIGDLKVLDGLEEALHILRDIRDKFQTHLTNEAYETARLMAQIASQAREQELAVLRRALSESPLLPVDPLPEFNQGDLDWAAFLNQDYFDLQGPSI